MKVWEVKRMIASSSRSSTTSNASDDLFYDTTDDESFNETLDETNTALSTPRRSERTAGRPQPSYILPKYYNYNSVSVPMTADEALSNPDAHYGVGLPVAKKAIPNKWVFETKLDSDGNLTNYKVRLVVEGCYR